MWKCENMKNLKSEARSMRSDQTSGFRPQTSDFRPPISDLIIYLRRKKINPCLCMYVCIGYSHIKSSLATGLLYPLLPAWRKFDIACPSSFVILLSPLRLFGQPIHKISKKSIFTHRFLSFFVFLPGKMSLYAKFIFLSN